MLTLSTATAYIVDYVSKKEKLNKLGKIKLFKILYLADWGKFQEKRRPLFDIAWYRIQKGPALKVNIWEELCVLLSENYSIEITWGQAINYPQVMFTAKKPIKVKISAEDKKFLTKAIDVVIDATAETAADITHQTEPMRWLIAQELALGGNVQFREFYLNDDERIKFSNLAKKYQSGQMDIPQIVHQMGGDWTSNNVVLFLEVMGINRKSSNLALLPAKRAKVLKKLLEFCLSSDSNSLVMSKWVEDTVIASQRIEGIFVSPDAFVEENQHSAAF